MSLIEHPVIAIGRNRSGQDSGDLDYAIKTDKLNKLHPLELIEILKMLADITHKVLDRIKERREEIKSEEGG